MDIVLGWTLREFFVQTKRGRLKKTTHDYIHNLTFIELFEIIQKYKLYIRLNIIYIFLLNISLIELKNDVKKYTVHCLTIVD